MLPATDGPTWNNHVPSMGNRWLAFPLSSQFNTMTPFLRKKLLKSKEESTKLVQYKQIPFTHVHMHGHTCMHACLWGKKAQIPVLFLVLFSVQYYCFALISHSGLAFVLEWFSLQGAQLVTQFGKKTTSLAFSHVWRHFHGLYFSNLDKHWDGW